MSDTQLTDNLYVRLARIMGQVDTIKKSGKTTSGASYNFAKDTDIYDAIRPLLASEQIAFFASMKSAHHADGQTSGGKPTIKTVCEFEFTFACAATGELHTSIWFGESHGNDDKNINKCSTIALKFFLMKTFMISTENPEDDPDYKGANSGSQRQQNQQNQQRSQNPPPQRQSEPPLPTGDPQPGEPPQPPANGNRPIVRGGDTEGRQPFTTPEALYGHLRRLAKEADAEDGLAPNNRVKLMFKLWNDYGKDDTLIKHIIYNAFAIDSTTQMKANECEGMIHWLEQNKGGVVTVERTMVQAALAAAKG